MSSLLGDNRRPPSPNELKHQLLGAAVAFNFIHQMIRHYPTFWAAAQESVCYSLYEQLVEACGVGRKVNADSLWQILITQKPKGKPEEAARA